MAVETDIKLDLSQAGVGKIVFFNPNRKEYQDFTPFWQGIEMNKILSGNFVEMFRSMGWGSWNNDNVETGRMRDAFTGQGGFPAVNRLREYKPTEMRWGINTSAQGFKTSSGTPYPIYPLSNNPAAFIGGSYANQIPIAFGEYIISVMQKMKGL